VSSKNRELLQVAATDQSQMEERFLQLEHRLRESVQQICAAVTQMVQHQTHLQSEVAALSNRHVRIDEDLAGAIQTQRETGCKLEELLAIQRELSKQLSDNQLAARDRFALMESRGRLFVGGTDDGIFLLKSGDLISDSVREGHAWDKHIIDALESSLHGRDQLAVEVGAHIGLLTIPLARRFKRVLAFEPNGFNYRLLAANVALNGLKDVDCINEAIYSECVEMSLAKFEKQEIPVPLEPDGSFDGWSATNLGAYSFSPDGSGIFPSLARTLDSYDLNDLAFLKIDAQGADGEVIVGASETIRRCRPVIVFEWEDELSKNFRVSRADVHRQLESDGYAIELLKEHNSKQRDFLAIPLAAS
jgi:FkbM family methyltransferase